MSGRSRFGLIFIIYIVIGVVVAASKNYLDIDNIQDVISAALGILLWPLLLLDVNLHIGKLDDDEKGRGLLLPAAALHRAYLALTRRRP